MRKEQVKEEIAPLRDDNKNGFVILMALATASITVLFNVLTGQLKFGFIFIGILGVVLLIPVLSWMKLNKDKIDSFIEELGELE